MLGGGVKGGQVYGNWLGLAESDLYQQRDVPVTTDFREAIATILKQHMQVSNTDLGKIFPGYQLTGNLNLLG